MHGDPGETPAWEVPLVFRGRGATTAPWALKALKALWGLVAPLVQTAVEARRAKKARGEKKAPRGRTVRAPLVPRTAAEGPPVRQAPLAQGT